MTAGRTRLTKPPSCFAMRSDIRSMKGWTPVSSLTAMLCASSLTRLRDSTSAGALYSCRPSTFLNGPGLCSVPGARHMRAVWNEPRLRGVIWARRHPRPRPQSISICKTTPRLPVKGLTRQLIDGYGASKFHIPWGKALALLQNFLAPHVHLQQPP